MRSIDAPLVSEMLEPSEPLAAALRWLTAWTVGGLPSLPPRVDAPEFSARGWLRGGSAVGGADGTLDKLRSAVAPPRDSEGGAAPLDWRRARAEPPDSAIALTLRMVIPEAMLRQLRLWRAPT